MVQNIENAFKKLFCGYDILKEDCQKSSENQTSFFSNPVSCYGHYYEKQMRSGTSNHTFLKLPNTFRSFLSLVTIT